MNRNNDINQLLNGLDPLSLRINLFKQGVFDFIVEGIAANSENDFEIGEEASHQKQRRALEILSDNEHDEFLYGGAAGGAKSWTGACWLIFSCLAYPDTNWFIARNQLKDLLDSVLKTINKVCKEYGITDYNFNAQKNYIKFGNGSVINFIEVKYKPSDPMYEDLGSTEYTGGWIEEIGEVHEMAAIVLGTRIGRHLNSKYKLKKKMFMTCNPKQNWGKMKFYDKHKNGSLYEENKILMDNG
jgi:phage terminase large subunit